MAAFRKSLLLAAAMSTSLALFACNSTEPSENNDAGPGAGPGTPSGSTAMLYDGKSWSLLLGMCPGSTTNASNLTMLSGSDSRIIYIQNRNFPATGTYTIQATANGASSLDADQVGVTMYHGDSLIAKATGGRVTISRPSTSTLRFEGTNIPLDNGKAFSFAATATMACTQP